MLLLSRRLCKVIGGDSVSARYGCQHSTQASPDRPLLAVRDNTRRRGAMKFVREMRPAAFALALTLCGLVTCDIESLPEFCKSPGLVSKVRFSLKSERNDTGPWVSTVSGERSTPGGVAGSDACPWEVRAGHEVTTCPLRSRGVRLAATIEMQSNLTDDDVAALVKKRDEVPPPTTEYKLKLDHSEYKLDLRLVKWELARQYCQQEGADLVVINSGKEALALRQMLAEHGDISEDPYENKQVWVGIHDRGSEGNFVTVYGEPLSNTGYVSWSLGEPNNLGSSSEGEDCVSMLRTGDYNDEICNKKLAFICERPHYPDLYS